MGHDFEQASRDFVLWLKQSPGTLVSHKVGLADFRHRGAGRGVVALEDIAENEELFTIPLAAALSVKNSSLKEYIPEALEDMDPWMSLVLVMIYESGLGEKSAWWLYLRLLPTDFDTLVYWSPSELAELQGSAVLKKIGKEDADELFRTVLLPLINNHADLFGEYASDFGGLEKEAMLLRVAHRMATLIVAYAFDLEEELGTRDGEDSLIDEANQAKAMVPLADMLNADGDKNNARLFQDEASITMIAIKAIPQGDEIFNDYGSLPRSDMLRRYGYVTDQYKKWDVVELDGEMVLSIASEHIQSNPQDLQIKLELAEGWDVLQMAYDLECQVDGQPLYIDPELIQFINIFTMDVGTLKRAKSSSSAPFQPQLTLVTALALQKIIMKRQREYRTSTAEDAMLLQDHSVRGREKKAIEVRYGEKEILGATLESLKERIEILQTRGSEVERSSRSRNLEEQGRNTKRRKI